MKASNLLSVKGFFEENRSAWKKHSSMLIFTVAFTFVAWILEGPFNLRILGNLPAHWFSEWCSFFFLGCFAADIKKTVIPATLIVGTTYFFTASIGLFILGFSSFNVLFSFVFVCPLLFGYIVMKVSNWRKARRR